MVMVMPMPMPTPTPVFHVNAPFNQYALKKRGLAARSPLCSQRADLLAEFLLKRPTLYLMKF